MPKSRPKAKCRFGPTKRGLERSVDAQQESPPLANTLDPPLTAGGCSAECDAPAQVVGPDRVTLTPPTIRRSSSPFSRYYPTAPEEPRPRHYRHVLERLGITQETLEARAAQEAEEFLRVANAERRLARIMPGTSTDVLRPLSKEDCLTLFNATGVPPLDSPLWGVWQWAADLGWARLPYEVEVEGDDYSFLNAYD